MSPTVPLYSNIIISRLTYLFNYLFLLIKVYNTISIKNEIMLYMLFYN